MFVIKEIPKFFPEYINGGRGKEITIFVKRKRIKFFKSTLMCVGRRKRNSFVRCKEKAEISLNVH